jgi:LacI family transcriptional regulator
MATIRDVAQECGVSVATVSYVLNGSSLPVRAETRHKVLEAARRLNYQPSGIARALVRRRMHIISTQFHVSATGLAIDAFSSGILQGILNAAGKTDYDVLVFSKPWPESQAAYVRDRRADGILVVAPRLGSDTIPSLLAFGIPVVALSTSGELWGVPAVDIDNEAGARLAAEHLLSLGHRRIAHLMGDADQPSAAARRTGFRGAMAAAGAAVPEEYIVSGRYKGEVNYEQTRRLLQLAEPPTALFAGNDLIALSALEAARDLGVAVPGEFSIVGFDDIPTAAYVSPPLTTIRQPLPEIGGAAFNLLVARVEGQSVPPTTQRVEPQLVVRGSTASPAYRRPVR